jgi:hypothetical protein
MKALRLLAAIVIACGILWLAQLAVRDCPTQPYVYENCLWLRVSSALEISAANRLGRAATLFTTGLGLLAALAFTFCYIFPSRSNGAGEETTPPRRD